MLSNGVNDQINDNVRLRFITQTDPQMQKILLTTFIPMATVPTLITVIVVLILQTMIITRAKQCLEPNNKI